MQVRRFRLEDRIELEELLGEQMPLEAIAEALERHPTSVAREVKRNRVKAPPVTRSKFRRNPCAHSPGCDITGVCGKRGCKRRCVVCEYTFCDLQCEHFSPEACTDTLSWPYCCNRCKRRSTCPDERYYYKARKAQAISDMRASASRRGIDQDAASLASLDDLVSPLLLKGQSPFHIWTHHRYEMGISLATFYSYINAGLLSASRMHLPRAVHFRPRRAKREGRGQRPDKRGRTYGDYLAYLHYEE